MFKPFQLFAFTATGTATIASIQFSLSNPVIAKNFASHFFDFPGTRREQNAKSELYSPFLVADDTTQTTDPRRKSLIPFEVDYNFSSFTHGYSSSSAKVERSNNTASWENGAITVTEETTFSIQPTIYPSFKEGTTTLQSLDGSEYFPFATITVTNNQEPNGIPYYNLARISFDSTITLSIKGASQPIDFAPLTIQRLAIGFDDFPQNREKDKNKDIVAFPQPSRYLNLQIINPQTGRPERSPFYFGYVGAVEGTPRSITGDELLLPGGRAGASAELNDGQTKTFTLYGRIFTDESQILTNNAIKQYVNRRGELDQNKPGKSPDPGMHQLYFTPGSNLNLDNAAKILGYDHFNWYQKITKNTRIPSSYSEIKFPYTDPPRESTDGRTTDDFPYYLNEKDYGVPGDKKDPFLGDEILNNGQTLRFSDQPTTSFSSQEDNRQLDFETYLVGVDPKDTFISTPLYKTVWRSNYTLKRIEGSSSGKVELIQPGISKLKESEKIPKSHYGEDVRLDLLGGGRLLYSGADIHKAEESRFTLYWFIREKLGEF
jgi:hypothetical protein